MEQQVILVLIVVLLVVILAALALSLGTGVDSLRQQLLPIIEQYSTLRYLPPPR